nr:hypothetical protein [Tanacetum cinerariifolium]
FNAPPSHRRPGARVLAATCQLPRGRGRGGAAAAAGGRRLPGRNL